MAVETPLECFLLRKRGLWQRACLWVHSRGALLPLRDGVTQLLPPPARNHSDLRMCCQASY